MAKRRQRGEVAVVPATDDLSLERVHAWLKGRASQLERYLQDFPFTATGADRVIAPLFAEIDNVCARLRAAEDVAKHLREIRLLTVAFDSQSGTSSPAARSARTASATSTNGAPNNRDRWRKRPLTEKERDDIRMDLLRARAAGPQALARVKLEARARHGLKPKAVAALLNTCTGKRYALNFAARVVSRALGAERQAQLVVQLSNLLGLKQNTIVRAVRESERS